LEQVKQLGFSPRDVRHIVLTHLDSDHAGGLENFPEAHVHVLEAESTSPWRLMKMHRSMRLHNQARLRDLANDDRSHVKVFCSHDPVSWKPSPASAPDGARFSAINGSCGLKLSRYPLVSCLRCPKSTRVW
jgi:glyoxylase-like metal-dependent hydrolase (beta-lactamase superfamily II)